MYGYAVLRLSVEAAGRTVAVDNLDGRGMSLATAWVDFMATDPSEANLRQRRFWAVTAAAPWVGPPAGAWHQATVEHGPFGLRGRVRDTTGLRAPRRVAEEDATVFEHRHVFVVPTHRRAALLAGEVMGRSRVHRKVAERFIQWFEQHHHGMTVSVAEMADGEFWNEFLEHADFIAMRVARQRPIPGYGDADGDGSDAIARFETVIQGAGRGEHLPRRLVLPLIRRQVSPQDAFALEFAPDEADVVLRSRGQQRTVHLVAAEPPSLVYPLGAPTRRDRPDDQEFYGAAEETLTRLVQTLPGV